MKKFGLNTFESRLFNRLSISSFKILNFTKSPCILKEEITDNYLRISLDNIFPNNSNSKVLRNNKKIENITFYSKYKIKTYDFISNLIVKTIGINNFNINLSLFKNFVNTNTNNLFKSFICKYDQLNLPNKYFNWTKGIIK